MLNDSKVLSYVKRRLGYPFTEIEYTDSDIIYMCKNEVLPYFFSQYVPVYKFLTIETNDSRYRTEYTNRFKIIDPDGADILNVFDIISDLRILSEYVTLSLVMSYTDLPTWYDMFIQRRTAELTSNSYQTYEFIHPVYVEIRPEISIMDKIMICYEAVHVNFETVPTYRHSLLLQLCEAYVKKNIAEIRKKYTNLSTPFGDININWDDLKNDGVDLWDKTIEKLEKIPPRTIIDIG